MKQNETNLVPNNTNILCCEKCDYKTSRQSQYNRHLLTDKHINRTFEINMKHNSSLPKIYLCDLCKEQFNSKTTLWRHKKKCVSFDINDTQQLIKYLMTENKEFKQMMVDQSKQMIELAKNAGNNVTNNNTTNNNQRFNLNFFLNETCKNAMNIEDFVSSIKVNLEDLEHTGRRGYVEGISNIFIKNLNNIEEHLRPLHCSDAKREVLYIKNNDEWIKETEEKPILTNAIKTIANENIKQISVWKQLHPGCTMSDSKKNMTYLKILSNSMCGINEHDIINNVHKIISNISKEVYINKK